MAFDLEHRKQRYLWKLFSCNRYPCKCHIIDYLTHSRSDFLCHTINNEKGELCLLYSTQIWTQVHHQRLVEKYFGPHWTWHKPLRNIRKREEWYNYQKFSVCKKKNKQYKNSSGQIEIRTQLSAMWCLWEALQNDADVKVIWGVMSDFSLLSK